MTIRRQPADFEVREKVSERFLAGLTALAGGREGHVVYEVSKMSVTTPEAAAALARALSLRPGQVAYGGLKDKHATTTQVMSVPAGALTAGPPERIEGERWSARLLGAGLEAVTACAIDGNRFRIVVRGLTMRDVREMGRRASLLRSEGTKEGPSTLLFVNYFGEQRFGSARHGKGWIARELIAGRFEEALRLSIGTPARKDTGVRRVFTRLAATHWGDWARLAREWPRCPERAAVEVLARTGDARRAFEALPYFQQEMPVDAYQSHLWNAAAGRVVESLVEPGARLSSADRSMVFAGCRGMPAAVREMGAVLPSPGMATGTLWGRTMLGVLSAEGLSPGDLRIPGLRRPEFGAGERALVAEAMGFVLGLPGADELDAGGRRLKRSVAFDLPRGAYATVLLRALGQ
ncbi:MAG: tRNA pseudouridine(13) synthase TruD [Phycisphaerae bacterium]|nr:tRNA pseudouridine(13) synthase TruD [Phycisphaerae bacterium]